MEFVDSHPVMGAKISCLHTQGGVRTFPLPSDPVQAVRWKKFPVGSCTSHNGGNVKRKKSDRNAARDTVEAVADVATDRIAPKLHDAADRVGPLAQSAADRVGPLAQSAADKVAPLAQSAAEKVGPYAESARERVSPYAHQAVEKVSPYAQQAAERVGPYAESAKKKGAKAAHDALEKYGPALDDAFDKVTPAVEAARHRVQDDLIPRLSDALDHAAGSAVAVEATKRGKATAAALKGEVAVPEPKKKSRWIKRLAIVAAIGGIAAVAAKKLLGSKDADWQAARPTATYGGTDSTAAKPKVWTDATDKAATEKDPVAKKATTDPTTPAKPSGVTPDPAGPSSTTPSSTTPSSTTPATGAAASKPAGEAPSSSSGDAVTGATTTGSAPASDSAATSYGEGSYVGEEPPVGYTIKGNERSKKYHLPDSSGYARTIAEVWFNSEDAAQAAGFTRAQR